jgi:hypothetical protein
VIRCPLFLLFGASSRLSRIVVFPAHRLPRAVKAAADGRPATRRGELMRGRLYISRHTARLAGHIHPLLPKSTAHLPHLFQASNGAQWLLRRRRRGKQRLRQAFPPLVGGTATVRGGLPGAARLPRVRRLASERGRHPDPAVANGRRPRRRY